MLTVIDQHRPWLMPSSTFAKMIQPHAGARDQPRAVKIAPLKSGAGQDFREAQFLSDTTITRMIKGKIVVS